MVGYDPACEDLAEVFIATHAPLVGYPQDDLDTLRRRLAQHIQEAIEDWLSALDTVLADRKEDR